MVGGVGVEEGAGDDHGLATEAFEEFPVPRFVITSCTSRMSASGMSVLSDDLPVVQVGVASERMTAVSGRSPRLIDS